MWKIEEVVRLGALLSSLRLLISIHLSASAHQPAFGHQCVHQCAAHTIREFESLMNGKYSIVLETSRE